LIAANRLDDAQGAVRQAVSALDKAAEKGVIHPNNVARHKSRLMLKYNSAISAAATAAAAEPAAKPARRATKKAAPSKAPARAAAKKPAAKPAAKKSTSKSKNS
jgi:small subunit ribosomal protein S20